MIPFLAAGAGRRIWGILDEATPQVGGTGIIENFGGEITFDSVNFKYPTRPDQTIINNLSFQIKPKSTTAIVGHSGSGKSTIPKLLFQYYQPTSGKILLDGNQIQELSYDWIRQNVAMVPQDSELFSNTIR